MRIGYGRVLPATRTPTPSATPSRRSAIRFSLTRLPARLLAVPSSDKALLVARAGDQLVVTKLDRLGRSLEHLMDLAKRFQADEVDLVVLDQGIDTSTAVGRMFFQILGAIAEHAVMSERTMEGLAAARARGRTGGQKAKLTPTPGTCRPADVRRDQPRRQAPLHRGTDRCRVRRHPPHHLQAPGAFEGA
jgi:Resolvase, N terminal domain